MPGHQCRSSCDNSNVVRVGNEIVQGRQLGRRFLASRRASNSCSLSVLVMKFHLKTSKQADIDCLDGFGYLGSASQRPKRYRSSPKAPVDKPLQEHL